jgi:hypothetical protein
MGVPEQIQKYPPATIVAGLFVVWLVYLVALAIYRLYFSPLAKLPGPKLAALSKWYEFYYEVLLKGHFTFQIQELHKKYGEREIVFIASHEAMHYWRTRTYMSSRLGPIVRITPDELHIDDYTFWDTLFVKYPKSRKYEWLNGRLGNEHSVFTTCDPVHHRMRRAPLNPM